MQTRKRIVHELEFARPAFVFMNLIDKKIFAAVFKKLLCQAIQGMVGKIHMFATWPDQTKHAIVPVDFVVHISVEFIVYAFQLTIHVLVEPLHEAPPFKSHSYSAILTRNRTVRVRFSSPRRTRRLRQHDMFPQWDRIIVARPLQHRCARYNSPRTSRGHP